MKKRSSTGNSKYHLVVSLSLLLCCFSWCDCVLAYNYFAFGSNMASSTMTNLRGLTPIACTAAVLHDHRLAFNIPGTPFIEPSWASVAVETGSVVHGVLYKLTEEDFAKVCQTEGVPFAYKLHRCRVVPYVGNGRTAGKEASSDEESQCVPAFTLCAGSRNLRKEQDIPPSQSYLNVLLRGANEFLLDSDYIEYLENIKCADNVIGNGFAEKLLQFAEMRKL